MSASRPGPMSVAIAFHDDAPLDQWLLYANRATWSGRGLCHGRGSGLQPGRPAPRLLLGEAMIRPLASGTRRHGQGSHNGDVSDSGDGPGGAGGRAEPVRSVRPAPVCENPNSTILSGITCSHAVATIMSEGATAVLGPEQSLRFD